ncbi:MAG: hypothetical protein GX952_07320 [Firmicutes bacterium]|nr:hypothetical protein [Bacillota bacterium]
MKKLVAVVVTLIIVLALQLPRLTREQKWNELVAFLVLWVVAVVYASLVALDVPLPSITEALISFLGG